jgi:murein DD-endopeptidase MepM/ murein hydrolase activator NlpD
MPRRALSLLPAVLVLALVFLALAATARAATGGTGAVPPSEAPAGAAGPSADGGVTPVAGSSASRATGGASAEAARGGSLDARRSGALAYGVPTRQRPIARLFRVAPGRVREGVRPRIRLRIDERGVAHVAARVVVVDAKTRRTAARFGLGRVQTGRVTSVRWPAGALLRAGTYTVRLHVKDPQGATLARAARATGKTRLEVRPRPRPEKSQPEPQPQPTTPVAPSGPVGPSSGVFPVQGPFTWGGADSRFGAGRTGHTHEGQDLMAAEGTPVVSPLAGVVRFVDYQAKGAGWYIVLDADDGRTLFFAHCQSSSVGVAVGQRVTAGQGLCRVGTTGSATGPHLHFEIWEGGWRDRGGHPIDPLAQLQSWAR